MILGGLKEIKDWKAVCEELDSSNTYLADFIKALKRDIDNLEYENRKLKSDIDDLEYRNRSLDNDVYDQERKLRSF